MRLLRVGSSHLLVSTCLAVVSAAHAQSADTAAETEADQTVNEGQDITKPVRRIDLRLEYTEPGDSGGSAGQLNKWSLKLRHDAPVQLDDTWKIALRIDLPVAYNNVPSSDNPSGGYRAGYGDTLVQALLIKTIDVRQAFGFGSQLIAPTATQDQFGNPLWRLLPTVGYRYALPDISPGSFFTTVVRYDFDFAGPSGNSHVSNLQLGPTFNIALPGTSFVTLYPSTDIRYNFMKKSWFVPFDASVGKLWKKRIVTSLEVGVPMYEGPNPIYKVKVEGRVGMFF
jgi:hypothetical protein